MITKIIITLGFLFVLGSFNNAVSQDWTPWKAAGNGVSYSYKECCPEGETKLFIFRFKHSKSTTTNLEAHIVLGPDTTSHQVASVRIKKGQIVSGTDRYLSYRGSWVEKVSVGKLNSEVE